MLQENFNHKADHDFKIQEADGHYRAVTHDEIIKAALEVINAQFSSQQPITCPEKTREFLQLQLAHIKHEIFAVLWMDSGNRPIAFEELFSGSIDGASVYPREVVKSGLQHNAAAAILCHNHPSGLTEPSQADKQITERLKKALDLFQIRTLDHIIVGESTYSFAEHGLL